MYPKVYKKTEFLASEKIKKSTKISNLKEPSVTNGSTAYILIFGLCFQLFSILIQHCCFRD